MFTAALSRSEMIEFCRSLRHNLSAGLAMRKVFGQLSQRGPVRVRQLSGRILAVLERGDSFQSAIENERTLPQLFRALASVGEETGHLPEVLGELEKYFILQQQLVRKVIAQSVAPVLQLIIAFLVIALLIFVLGFIAQTRGGITPPGVFGLTGGAGAILFLVLSFGSIAMLFVVYRLTKAFRQKIGFDAFIMRVPGVGPCLQSVMLGRFCLALHLTLDTPMAIAKALRLSLDVAGNSTMLKYADSAAKALRSRKSFADALAKCRILPVDFLAIVASAEEAGSLPEAMRHQADRYYEEATYRLKSLTTVFTFFIWLVYAIFMIIAIFYIANIYLSALQG